ncbi:hypothetical protein ACFFX0_07600 [Citricoccus parietis]|uniref:Uncharacterized protein n=1 Tax=Citricoccus parietis TaxID=592307 RepID=A0ABV5FWK9_9MICC
MASSSSTAPAWVGETLSQSISTAIRVVALEVSVMVSPYRDPPDPPESQGWTAAFPPLGTPVLQDPYMRAECGLRCGERRYRRASRPLFRHP